MKLLYLWVEDYKNIKKQGFNFSEEHKFNFNITKTHLLEKGTKYEKEIVLEGDVTYKKNENKDINIFDKDVNISIIVGRNGAGKTSLGEFLLQFSGHYGNTVHNLEFNHFHQFRAILIHESNGIFHITENLSILENKENKSKGKIVCKEIKLHKNKRAILSISDFDIVYYNNLIGNQKSVFKNVNNIKNLSSNHSLSKSIKTVLLNNELSQESDEYEIQEYINKIFYQHSLDSTTKIIKYLSKNPCNFIDIKYFSIWINEDTRYQKNKFSVFNRIDEYIKSSSKEYLDLFFINLFKVGFSKLINNFQSTTFIEDKNDISKNLHFNSLMEINNNVVDLIDKNTINIKNIINIIEETNDYYIKEKDLLNILKLLYQYSSKILDSRRNIILLEINDDLSKLISSLDLFFRDIFNFSFESETYFQGRTLSAGELYICNIFAKLYLDATINISNNILIVFDEIEVALHPDWQKKLISNLLEEVKNIFPNKKIHIIITTHSPFLLSDIPKSNILFLNKDDKGSCNVVDGIDKSNTFGANIHTLLSDSFFMKDGTMGEFAKGKINDVITFLNLKLDGKPQNLELNMTQKDAESIISIIGEPFLKEKLEEMYLRAFGDDKEARKEALLRKKEEIEKELEEYK